jgi:hypothetical protein
MAAWQFDAHLLPEVAIQRPDGSLPIAIARADINAGDWWKGTKLPADFAERLSSVLPQGSSWSSSLQTWGQEDGDRVDLVWEDDELADIFLRVDVRRVSYDRLDKVLRLARAYRWVLWTGGQILRPSLGQLLRAIQRSDAFRFVQDPEGFLLALGRTVERDAPDL